MAMITADALLQVRRIRTIGEHVGIVVELQQQGIQTTEGILDVPRDVPGVGQDAKSLAVVRLTENKL